ncbi:hypothetical protein Pan14r_12770 [Crateriforma conspicua]|uniref:TIGR04255 family protein n=2 Tax=Crateriforma conspicua TaxID=2527996 RepID=A0A5C5Y2S5_9PLAN|nr:hypothetical protein [Crateriforma conspicua]QDV63504.1 hypothetical protein Mal65_26480 [Crateriforma conspicua]TWT68993.1 hypothetical protein Pan14r_12770 [Crateriforma conspicua]
MLGYSDYCDEYYVNMNLSTEMSLPQTRESVLHYFEQVRRRYPSMVNFYNREANEFVLEEEKDNGTYRWVGTESKRVNSGVVNPESYDSACEQHRAVLDLVPYELSVSPLDCESLSVMLGFDFAYKGNHNEILTEAIGIAPGLEKFANLPYGKVLSNEPAIQFSLDEECRTQCRIGFESRTNAYQIRTGEFSEDQLSVYLTVRRYDSLAPTETYVSEFDRLSSLCRDLVDEYLIESVLQPLQKTISLR